MAGSVAAVSVLFLVAGCAGGTDAGDASNSAEAVTAHSDKVDHFVCTSVASSTSNDHLKSTKLDIEPDETVAGVPTGNLVTGFFPTLQATSGIGVGVSHVRDTTESGHSVSEYKFDFGEDGILPGSTGGTLMLPTAFVHFALETSAALNVITMKLTPSNATVTYKCKKGAKITPAPAPDPLVFEGAAKDVVAKDKCAKDVASAVMDKLVEVIEDHGVDVPDTFTFTSIDKTDTGYKMVVNGAKVPVVVAAGCNIKSIDTSAAGSLGE
jgi:hypothetical protein